MTKFPKLIHVTEEGENDGVYFQVSTDGVASLEESGKDVAIYQLVKVGRVRIEKTFEEKRERSK